MKLSALIATSFIFCPTVLAQNAPAMRTVVTLAPQTTLPIFFTQNLDARRLHAGDAVTARTVQPVPLSSGEVIAAGATVTGHVVTSEAFNFDKTPYAKQKPSSLAVHFDTLAGKSGVIPLNVYVRAMASPISSWDARKPKPSDEDSDGTLTQIGGEMLKPHQGEVINMDGDVVGYEKKGGVYAHLAAASGNSSEGCDGSDTEQSTAIFSSSACGLYGFSGTAMQSSGRTGQPSTLVLTSRTGTTVIWKNTTALLETLPNTQVTASR